MPNITGLTIAQLRSTNKAQKLTAWQSGLASLSNAQLAILDLLCRSIDTPVSLTIFDDPIVVRRGDGQYSSIVDVDRDAVSAAILQTRTVSYSYYANGDVDAIVIVAQDGAGTETNRKTIKHYQDGRQPTVN